MAKYSPIAPLPILRQLHEHDALGNYLLLLAHDILDNALEYADLVEELENNMEYPRFIVVDNGVIELGTALKVDQVIAAAQIVEADAIIMPDAIGDFHETQKLVMAQGRQLAESGFDIMKVPQGVDVGELVKCVDWLRDKSIPGTDPDLWGIPRWVANEMGSRMPIIQYINACCADPKIHLLGMSKDLQDDLRCMQLPGVMGIDSANPVTLGLANIKMSPHTYSHMDRGHLWACTQIHSHVLDNVRFMHEAGS